MKLPGSKPKAVNGNGKKVYQKKVEFFAWEKLDYVDKIKKTFSFKLKDISLVLLPLRLSSMFWTIGDMKKKVENYKNKDISLVFLPPAPLKRG